MTRAELLTALKQTSPITNWDYRIAKYVPDDRFYLLPRELRAALIEMLREKEP